MVFPPKPTYKKGDTRSSTKFAFLPTKMSSGAIIWLEDYILIEEYNTWGHHPCDVSELSWQTKEKIYIPNKSH